MDGASFGPEALKVIGQAFDAAWVQIAGYFGNDPIDIKKGRIRLAHAVLSVADDDGRDVGVLRQAALERMASAFHGLEAMEAFRTQEMVLHGPGAPRAKRQRVWLWLR